MFTTYEHNPFLHFFKRGLNCSLSTGSFFLLLLVSSPLIETIHRQSFDVAHHFGAFDRGVYYRRESLEAKVCRYLLELSRETRAEPLHHHSITDLSEIARNSVLQCGFPDSEKKNWIGENFQRPGVDGNGSFLLCFPQKTVYV